MEYPLTYLYLLATLAMVAVTAVVALVGDRGPVKTFLVLLTAFIALWNLTELLSNLALTVGALARVDKGAAFVWPPIPYLILMATLAYVGNERWRRPLPMALLALPAIGCVVLAASGLLRTELAVASAEVPYFHSNVTGWFHVASVYALVYPLAAALVLVQAARTSGRPGVARTAWLVALGVVPVGILSVVVNGQLAMAGVTSPHLGAVATAIVGVVLAAGIARRRLFQQDMLRTGEERYRALLETSPDAILLVSEQVVIAANQPAVELFGFTDRASALNVRDPVTTLVAPEDRERAGGFMARILAGERFSGVEITVQTRHRGPRLVDVTAGPILDIEGQPVGLVVAGRDITDRRHEEEERRALEAQLQQAQKLESLGVLAGGIAHDFNNLLVGILGNAGLTRLSAPGNAEVQERVAHIEAAAQRAAGLAQQMLNYTGRGTADVQLIDLAAVATEMAELLRVSMSRTIELEFNIDPSLPAVRGDPVQLQQVVMNLITNASESIGEAEGRITIRTTAAAVAAGEVIESGSGAVLDAGDYVCLEVADSGCGIKDVDRVFEPFFTTKFTGRGLGLAAVLGIARAHDGAVVLESTVGEGTRARIYLPVASRDSAAVDEARAMQAEFRGEGTVLVVDDEAMVREVACRILKRAGFDVIEAEDGQQAIACVEARDGSLRAVLLDVAMPRMRGTEALARIRQLSADLPVILMSGYTEEELRDGLAGCSFVHKPFGPETLLAAFRDLPSR